MVRREIIDMGNWYQLLEATLGEWIGCSGARQVVLAFVRPDEKTAGPNCSCKLLPGEHIAGSMLVGKMGKMVNSPGLDRRTIPVEGTVGLRIIQFAVRRSLDEHPSGNLVLIQHG